MPADEEDNDIALKEVARLSTVSLGRTFRSASFVELGENIPNCVTWKDDALHILRWEVKLWPSILFVIIAIILNRWFAAYLVKSMDDTYRMIINPIIGFACFSVSATNIYRGFNMKWVHILIVLTTMFVTCGALLALMIEQGFPWDLHKSLAFLSIAFGFSGAVNVYTAQMIQVAHPCSFRAIFVSLTTWLVSGIAIIVIFEYGCLSSNLNNWIVEWLVTGLAYPIISICVGRLLVADFYSFMLLWAFPQGSCKAVMSYYSILVKIAFSLSGQIAIMFVSSSYSFGLSVAVTTVSELAGTYINVLATKWIQAKAEKNDFDKESEFVIEQWFAVRASLASERLVLHTHDESIGEKLVIFSAITLAISSGISGANTAISVEEFAIRGLVLILAEFVQDMLQRRVLLLASGLSVVGIKPHFLSLRENMNNICLILMTFNFFWASQ